MPAPPSEAGTSQLIPDVWFSDESAVSERGALGTVDGVALTIAGSELPKELMALMEKLYSTPLVSPVNLQTNRMVFAQLEGALTIGDEVTE
jgi:hypothetical protein